MSWSCWCAASAMWTWMTGDSILSTRTATAQTTLSFSGSGRLCCWWTLRSVSGCCSLSRGRPEYLWMDLLNFMVPMVLSCLQSSNGGVLTNCPELTHALTALTYLHTKPSKIYERNFSWLWKTLKDLREWIKRPPPRVVVRPASPACTFAFA